MSSAQSSHVANYKVLDLDPFLSTELCAKIIAWMLHRIAVGVQVP